MKTNRFDVIDVVVDDSFKTSICSNLSEVNKVIDSREGFYRICEDLVRSEALREVSSDSLSAMLDRIMVAKGGVGVARSLLTGLKGEMIDFLQVDGIELDNGDKPDFTEIKYVDYKTMIDMLKVYMYGSYAKSKSALKEARELFKTRDILKRASKDEALDRRYAGSLNYHYVSSLTEVCNKVGTYRGIAEDLIKMAKHCDKVQSNECLGTK